jgi:DNA-binding response OmpR family regulator
MRTVTDGPGSDGGARILVVDDEEQVRLVVCRYLALEGYVVEEAGDAREALEAMERRRPDLMLLDVMLPSQDGLDLLARLRQTSDLPVILLSALGNEADRVIGLKLGADDYVVKPFSPTELAARISSVLRRTSRPRSRSRLELGDLVIDLDTRQVFAAGNAVDLRAREFDLLAFLAKAPRQVFSREQLLHQVWDSSSEWQDPRTVNEHVRRIRRQIEADPDNPRWVKTARGVGYYLQP